MDIVSFFRIESNYFPIYHTRIAGDMEHSQIYERLDSFDDAKCLGEYIKNTCIFYVMRHFSASFWRKCSLAGKILISYIL